MKDHREPAVAGLFYPADGSALRTMVEGFLAEVDAAPQAARAAIAPHAGLVYSGRCAAHVFKRLVIPPLVVIVAPNHRRRYDNAGGAGAWDHGCFDTPLGPISIAEDLVAALERRCALVDHDVSAHAREHAIEVELPFLAVCAPEARIVPLLLAWDDWPRCQTLAGALAATITEARDPVLLLASSDMTHYEPAESAARKDRLALAEVERLDPRAMLAVCRRHRISMCGRAAAAVVLEAARQLGATGGTVVDYRHSGMVTGDDADVVAYAGVVIP